MLLSAGGGTFRPAVAYVVENNPVFAAVGDFNGDGHADLAVTSLGSSNVSILLGNGDGSFGPAVRREITEALARSARNPR